MVVKTISDNILAVKASKTRMAIFKPCVAGALGDP